MKINIEDLTIGELETIEEVCGCSLDKLDFEHPTAKLMLAIVYVAGRRENPDFSLDDARQVRLTEVELTADPTGAAS